MPKLSKKRQITLPIDQCNKVGFQNGDELVSYVDNFGRITLLKKTSGAAFGVLAGTKANLRVSEEESRQSSIEP